MATESPFFPPAKSFLKFSENPQGDLCNHSFPAYLLRHSVAENLPLQHRLAFSPDKAAIKEESELSREESSGASVHIYNYYFNSSSPIDLNLILLERNFTLKLLIHLHFLLLSILITHIVSGI